MYEITIMLLFLALIILFFDVSNSLRKLVSFKGVETKLMIGEEEEVMSDYEKEKRIREEMLDSRIRQLQLELDNNTYGTPAEVTMNGIYNIPHSDVKIKHNTPDTEIAD